MITQKDIEWRSEAVLALLHSKMGIRARNLENGVRRAHRRLPRRVRRQCRLLVEADRHAGHPKLARQIDEKAVAHAFEVVRDHLSAIDAAAQRKGRLLDLAAAAAFNLLLVLTAFIAWLWWRGYV